MNTNNSNQVNSFKQSKKTKISLPLKMVTAFLLVCSITLPAQAENDDDEDGAPTPKNTAKSNTTGARKTNRYSMFYRNSYSVPTEFAINGNWKVAKENIDKFFTLSDQAIADLFGYKTDKSYPKIIDMDENTALRVPRSLSRPVTSFSFTPRSKGLTNSALVGSVKFGPFWAASDSDIVWSGAKRKDEKEYWTIIKANLDKFIGMSSDEVVALLGTERCSSKSHTFIKYRIGDAGLAFFLKDGKVEKFEFNSNQYIPGT
ncbi:MAG: hypothetical protein WC028_24775 [Candidatus Obscuribacterales bacterium]